MRPRDSLTSALLARYQRMEVRAMSVPPVTDDRIRGAIPFADRAAAIARLAPRIVFDGEGAPRGRLAILRAFFCAANVRTPSRRTPR